MPIRSRLSFAVFLAAGAATAHSQTQAPAQFRGGVTLVPIEVRAVDRDGRPVTDLTAKEFVIREANRPQEVAHFRSVSLESTLPDTPGRTFVIVLGRGRLNQPTKALQALADFVRTKMLPQDRIGVAAWLQIVEPTTDHGAVAQFLERYRDRHETVDGLMRGDMRATMWPIPPTISARTREAMNAVLTPSAPLIRDLPGGQGNALSRHNDFNYLRKSLEYLRALDGDKHAIIVTERPFGMGLVHDDPLKNYWFRVATGARTAISYIHAGGMTGSIFHTTTAIDGGTVKDYALVAGQTGGLAAFYRFADQPLASLDRTTRHHYVLGYYPTEQVPSNEFRSFVVSVTRPDVRLLYRQGYLAEARAERPEEYKQALVDTRLRDGAERILNPFPDLPGTLRWEMRVAKPEWTAASAGGGQARVAVSFDPAWVHFTKDSGGYLTDIELLLLADDEKRGVLTERRVKLNVRLSEAEFARIKREWLTYEATIEVTKKPAHLRAVLYDFETDRSASGQVTLLPPRSSGGAH